MILYIVFVVVVLSVSLCQCSFVCVRHSIFYVCVVLCVSLSQCSFVCVRHSIFYVCVTCCDLERHYQTEKAREKARGNSNGLSHVPSKRKEEIKSGTSACGSFVVPYCHRPFTLKQNEAQSARAESTHKGVKF